MKILGIETSCDETAVAIVDGDKNILAQVIHSQIELHKPFGGVVPELAARSHIEILDSLIAEVLQKSNLQLDELDAIAATAGPGLIGGVIVGLTAGKTLASVLQKPFIAVNHLEAHALTARLTSEVEFPYLLLLLSGGHCQILLAEGVSRYQKIGETIDDALGEAFDKVAQMLGMAYPGGPAVEKLARDGDDCRFKFPRPLIDSDFEKKHLFDFSFSGLKTAVRREVEKLTGEEFSHFTSAQKLQQQDKADICASFQKTVGDILLNRLENVFYYNMARGSDGNGLQDSSEKLYGEIAEKKSATKIAVDKIVIAGGVAANRYIFARLQEWAAARKIEIITPPLALCTDNAAMIAWAGIEKLRLSLTDELNFKPRARWEIST